VSVLNTQERDDAPPSPYVPADCYSLEGLGLAERIKELAAVKSVELIIPTKDSLVRFCVEELADLKEKLFLPGPNVVSALQDKLATYRILSKCKELRIPEFYESSPACAQDVAAMIRRAGAGFQKPRTGSSGMGAKRLTRIEDLTWSRDTLVCEELRMPEYNQTLVVRRGSLRGSVTYRSSREGFAPVDNVQPVRDLVEGRVAIRFLREVFGDEMEGVFNIDFMLNEDGWLVLNEINPGRFPAGTYSLAPRFSNLVREVL
jgi:predicted ATP-grasp superfamily ATP-dependent carboligase